MDKWETRSVWIACFLHFARRFCKPFLSLSLTHRKLFIMLILPLFPLTLQCLHHQSNLFHAYVRKNSIKNTTAKIKNFPCVGPTLCGCDITVLYSRLQPVGRGGSRAGTLTGPVSLKRPVRHHVPKLQIPQQHSVLSVQRRCARYPVPLR